MDLASLALLATVGAGYGVPVDGLPSHEERVLHLWTNAARVAPGEFDAEYQVGGCDFDDFEDAEKSPKAPLYLDRGLTEASRYHSVTMEENPPCFQHESCDGSGDDFGTRVARYYSDSGFVGENIAMGTSDPRYAVMSMWMCSAGHRSNIMTESFNELGPGVSGIYMTQDFGAGTLADGEPPVRMAVDDAGTWYADWGDDERPAGLQVVIEGVVTDMGLTFGEAEQGIYAADPTVDDDGCSAWYVWWETTAGEQGTFPAEGSWLYGAACEADWTEVQTPRGGLFGDVPEDELHAKMLDDLSLVGCSSTSRAAGLLGLTGAALLVLRRRRVW